MIELEEKATQLGTNIKIIGVGGAGGNAVNTMITNGLTGVEFIVANTDNSDLLKSKANMKIQLGKRLTRGLGTGADPEKGARSAEESKDEIRSHLEGADMVFITAGMGGGTGTGAAPIVAKIAREMGILSLGIVTTPFDFEGKRRHTNAEEGIRHLSEFVDTLILIPNNKLSEIYSDLKMIDAFHKADNILYEAAKAVSDIINMNGYINLDFADVKAVMENMGYALMGTGSASGQDRAINAAKAAINNPLLSDISLNCCQALLINVIAGLDISMEEFNVVTDVIVNETGHAANIIIGTSFDENITDQISVTIIATGLQRCDSGNTIIFPKIEPPAKPATAAAATPKPTLHTEPPAPKPKPNINDEAEDIFAQLQMNRRPQNEEPAPTTPTDDSKPLNPRADLPSFLKALD